jgi:hypothetical protein
LAPGDIPDIADACGGVKRAQVSRAWLLRNPVVAALEAFCTTRRVDRGVSDSAVTARFSAQSGIEPAGA